MIDTHTHIFCKEFDDDLGEVMERAISNGVHSMILPAIDSRSHERLFEICEKYESCYPTIGLHPTSVDEGFKKELDTIESYFNRFKKDIVAIGEVGIDLYWSSEFLKEQKEAFAYQVEMALKHSLPLIIHTRNAFDEMFDILSGYRNQPIRGVFHSYDQNIEIYEKMSIFDGFYFGIGGIVTFKKSTISKSIEHIPLERVVLETDAPYLTPSPYRGKRNEPSYLKYILEEIAKIKGIEKKIVEDITEKNSKELFGI